MKVKVIYKGGIVENGKVYKQGTIIELSLERVKALGSLIEAIEQTPGKSFKNKKDKMVRKAKNK